MGRRVRRGHGPQPRRPGYHHRRPGCRPTAHAEPTFTISAEASDLDAWLWRRPVGAGVSVDGALHGAAPFTAIITEGIRSPAAAADPVDHQIDLTTAEAVPVAGARQLIGTGQLRSGQE